MTRSAHQIIVGIVLSWLALGAPHPANAEFSFVNCTGNEETITDAYSLAFSRAKEAEESVGDNELYDTWFGTWTQERDAIVKSKLADIIAHSLIGTPAFTCYPAGDPECDEDGDGVDDTTAFVYLEESFEIHLCDPFWTVEQGDEGIDKTDVLIHEVAHFHLGANTEDHCYGDSGIGSCVDLAIANPDEAVNNADSYMHFIKNAPFGF